ncbi:MAG TPA: calcium-binding protein, partial [Kamptonema sp.]|nr:calcium-binding protein [Kamptonema sp.]
SGNDVFIFSPGQGNDVITDFQKGQDAIGLAGGLTFDQLNISSGSNVTTISFASTGQVLATVNGVAANTLGAEDFRVI